jgi:acyl-coenzyme A thioesterase PaaI-like protein
MSNTETQESPPPMTDGHPMAKHIGQVFIEVSEDHRVSMSIPFNESFVGNTVTQSMHLGPITALLDSAAGFSVMQANGALAPFVTLDLRIDQFRPANEKTDITVGCKAFHKEGDLFFVEGEAWQSKREEPVLGFHSVFMAAHRPFNEDGSTKEAPPLEASIKNNDPVISELQFTAEDHSIFKVVPYANDLALEVGKDEAGKRLVKFPFADKHIGNPVTRALQGGIFLGFMECAGSVYLLDIYPELKQCVSASFFMEYLKAPKPKETYARISASKIGRRVVNIDIEAFQLERGIVAKASGRYLVV